MKGIRHYIKTIKNLLHIHGFSHDAFFTYHYRPKKADDVKNYEPEMITDVCIVIQGPIKHEDDFTIETVKLYKKYYPQTSIIVSTWDIEPEDDVNTLKHLCGEDNICISHYEKDSSINYQRKTSRAGIKKAKETGCKYILKTRTDQRAYAPQILSFLKLLWKNNPLQIDCAAEGRIIVNGMGTLSDRLYDMSDMFIFGAANDLFRYFSCPIDTRDNITIHNIQYQNYKQYQTEISNLRTGEIWFATHYIESLGFMLKWTFEDSDYYRNQFFIIVDNAMIDLYWPKYSSKEYRWLNYYDTEAYHPVFYKEWYLQQNEETRV